MFNLPFGTVSQNCFKTDFRNFVSNLLKNANKTRNNQLLFLLPKQFQNNSNETKEKLRESTREEVHLLANQNTNINQPANIHNA